MNLANYIILNKCPLGQILQNKLNQQIVIQKILDTSGTTVQSFQELVNYLEKRKALHKLSKNIIEVLDYALPQTSQITQQPSILDNYVTLLFESWSMNFKQSLFKRQITKNYWSEDELIATFESILQALTVMHENDLIHGNISIQSICCQFDGTIKLADSFCFGKYLFTNQIDLLLNNEEAFPAPELLQSANNSIKDYPTGILTLQQGKLNDIFAVGLVFLEAASLKPSKTLYNRINQSFEFDFLNQRILTLEEHYSPFLKDIISQMCMLDQKARITAKQALQLVQQYNLLLQQQNVEKNPLPLNQLQFYINQQNIIKNDDKNYASYMNKQDKNNILSYQTYQTEQQSINDKYYQESENIDDDGDNESMDLKNTLKSIQISRISKATREIEDSISIGSCQQQININGQSKFEQSNTLNRSSNYNNQQNYNSYVKKDGTTQYFNSGLINFDKDSTTNTYNLQQINDMNNIIQYQYKSTTTTYNNTNLLKNDYLNQDQIQLQNKYLEEKLNEIQAQNFNEIQDTVSSLNIQDNDCNFNQFQFQDNNNNNHYLNNQQITNLKQKFKQMEYLTQNSIQKKDQQVIPQFNQTRVLQFQRNKLESSFVKKILKSEMSNDTSMLLENNPCQQLINYFL